MRNERVCSGGDVTLAKSKSHDSQPRWPRGNHHRLLSFVYLNSFLDDWTDLGLDESDLQTLEKLIQDRPEVGVVIPGTGGLRKVRFAPTKGNKGKSGSERVCYALFPKPGLVLMVIVFGKDDKDNLTPAERNEVKAMLAKYEVQLNKRSNP
jgi:hypothetical protein